MNKKAYFFILDAAGAALILIIGYMLISTTSVSKPNQYYNKNVADDLLNVLANTKVLDLCRQSPCTDIKLNTIFTNGNVKNTNNTLLELFGELYFRDPETVSGTITTRAYIKQLADSLISSNDLFYKEVYGVAVFIEDDLVYYYDPLSPTQNDETDISNFKTQIKYLKIENLLSSKKIILGYYEDESTGTLTFWGPYTVELWVWQKP